MRSERNVDPYAVTVGYQSPLQCGTDAVEHLKLETLGSDAVLRGVCLDRGDQALVVRRNRRVNATGQQCFRHPQILASDRRHLLIRNLGGLAVRALAEPDARAERDRAFDVAWRTA